MPRIDEYEGQDALGLAAWVRDGEVTPIELLEAAMARVEARDPLINAVVIRAFEEGRKAIEAKLPDGPFRGVPWLLKDLYAAWKGVRLTNGSRFFADAVDDFETELVSRYRRAGLVFFGRSASPEFGITTTTESTLFGQTRNPWNLEHSAGGSSGGAAAAVAAGILPAAHASDGGGSIRIPASGCGLFGMKPTRARVPAGPKAGEGWSGMSTAHAVTRSVRDSAALLDACALRSRRRPSTAPTWIPSASARRATPPRCVAASVTTSSRRSCASIARRWVAPPRWSSRRTCTPRSPSAPRRSVARSRPSTSCR
jgi:Asp-tRNA(Asn)/Glu-tRNA(Gln) amidotransferase A subunit family amidase